MSFFKNIFTSMKLPFGLDIGYTSVRAVQLEKRGKLVHLAGYGETPIKEGVVSRDTINTDELAFAIKQVLKESKIKPISSKQVVCALPESEIFIKTLQLPKMEESEAEEAIKFEIEKIVPFPIDQLYLDYKKVREGGPKENDNIIVVAGQQKMIHSYMDALKKAELEVIALDVEPAAVARALIKNSETEKDAYAIIDMGADSTTITLYDYGSIQITGSTHIAGNEITNSLAKELNLEKSKAEEIKRHIINSDRRIKPQLFEKAVKPVLEKLAKEVERSINYYLNFMKDPHDIKKIIITGGNAQLEGITDFFTKKFDIKTEVGNPWNNVTAYPLKAIPKIKASLYTTAIGLALRELVE